MKTNKDTNTAQLMIRCDIDLARELRELARKNDRSLSSQLRRMLRDCIAAYAAEGEEEK